MTAPTAPMTLVPVADLDFHESMCNHGRYFGCSCACKLEWFARPGALLATNIEVGDIGIEVWVQRHNPRIISWRADLGSYTQSGDAPNDGDGALLAAARVALAWFNEKVEESMEPRG
jgi:hypothetical protein